MMHIILYVVGYVFIGTVVGTIMDRVTGGLPKEQTLRSFFVNMLWPIIVLAAAMVFAFKAMFYICVTLPTKIVDTVFLAGDKKEE
jgi:ABC-type anion transport system duplicated permease subunit